MIKNQSQFNKDQLKECILDLAKRADDINEQDISIVLYTLAGAVTTGDDLSLPTFAAVCQSFAYLELEKIENMLDNEESKDN